MNTPTPELMPYQKQFFDAASPLLLFGSESAAEGWLRSYEDAVTHYYLVRHTKEFIFFIERSAACPVTITKVFSPVEIDISFTVVFHTEHGNLTYTTTSVRDLIAFISWFIQCQL